MVDRNIHFTATGDASGAIGAMNEVDAALGKQAKAFAVLRDTVGGTYDPYISGAKQAQASTTSVKQFVNQNAAAFNRLETQIRNSAGGLGTWSKRAKTVATQSNKASIQTANLGAQFNDIGVMLAAGQSPLLLAVQQGTQINQVLDQMGGTGRQKVVSLMGAFSNMISPANLATLAIIAGGAALLQWGMNALSAGEDADSLADRLLDVREKTTELNRELRELRLGVTPEELVLIDAMAQKQREIAEIQKNISDGIDRGERGLEFQLKTATQELTVFQNQLETLRRQQSAKERLVRSTQEMADAERKVWETSKDVSKEAESLVKEIGMAATRALVLADVDITSPISSAKKEAALLAANMGIALDAALKLQDAGVQQENRPKMRPMDLGAEDPTRPQMRPMDLGVPAVTGGGANTDDTSDRIQALRESMETETETELRLFEERRELLGEAMDRRLIDQEEFQELSKESAKKYQDALSTIEKGAAQSRRDAIAGALSDAASLMQSGNEKLFKIGKAAALAEAVVNGYSAAVAAWDKGMKVGGPPVAAAFTAASLARTGALVSQIASTSIGGGGSSGSAGAGSAAGASAGVVDTQRVDINIVGGTDRDRTVAQEIISVLNNAQRDGFRLDPRLIGGT